MLKATMIEINFDGLPGPTHHYGGLAFGDLASMQHAAQVANPRACALQSLAKMRLLLELGVAQAFLPPHERPVLSALRALDISADTQRSLEILYKKDQKRFAALFSASSMWAANSATVTPSCDSANHKVHITPANLAKDQHRQFETAFTAELLHKIFHDTQHFQVHSPLDARQDQLDEGAANHTRLADGLHIFTYGRAQHNGLAPKHYPARQTQAACEAIAAQHQLNPHDTFFIQQNPLVIDQGVFHNDVIATGHDTIWIYHEQAFLNANALRDKLASLENLHTYEIDSSALSMSDAVQSYLFNMQIVTLPDNSMAMIVPIECQTNENTATVLKALLTADNPIKHLHYVDVTQSMHNGGGPACLRLRVPLNETEYHALPDNFLLTQEKIQMLEQWVKKYYRDRLTLEDLLDTSFRQSNYQALDELTQICEFGHLYPFQR